MNKNEERYQQARPRVRCLRVAPRFSSYGRPQSDWNWQTASWPDCSGSSHRVRRAV